ncbi:MAG: hypothetical protein ACI39W_09610 [Brotaphodocola sp.]
MKWTNLAKKLAIAAMTGLLAAAGTMTVFAATRLDTVTNPYWDEEDDTIAIWDEVDEAYRYEVYLYCDESKVAEIKTKDTEYNFEKKMTKAGEYTFRVRALAKGSGYKDGYWSEYSDSTYVSEDFAELMKNGGVIDTVTSGPGAIEGGTPTDAISVVNRYGEWISDSTGWWYKNADGTWPSNGWWQDPADSVWYYFNEQGYIVTGWIDWNGARYYCAESGAMVTGTQTIDGEECLFDASGVLQ